MRRRAQIEAHIVQRRGIDVRSKDLYPRPVRGRPGFLMATPPEHERALVLGGLRDGLRTAGLADPGLSRNQDYLTPAREHAAERGATKVQFARATNDESMRTFNRIAHVGLIRLAHFHQVLYRNGG